MIYFGMSLILLLFLVLTVNTGVVLYRWLKTIHEKTSPLVFGLVFGVLVTAVLALFVLSRVPNIPIPRVLLRLSHYGLGVFIYALLFVNLTALLLFLGKVVRLVPTPRPRPVTVTALTLCATLVLGLSSWGMVNAGNVKTVSYSVTVDKTTTGTKIALVSDLHIGYVVDETHLQKIAAEINRMEPDMICIAGDIFDGDMTALSDPEALKAVFRSIHAPIYACLGNHDAGPSYPQMVDFLADAGVRLLQDEAVVVDDRVLLVGRRDPSPIGGHDRERTDVEIPADHPLPVVVLDHQPGNISRYDENVDLILCGHTHKGQFFPGDLVTGRIYDVDYGYYRASATAPQVIVTSGAGTWGPVLRVGTKCEVVEINLN